MKIQIKIADGLPKQPPSTGSSKNHSVPPPTCAPPYSKHHDHFKNKLIEPPRPCALNSLVLHLVFSPVFIPIPAMLPFA